jgi:Protein of unknown function (DUF1592)/Protein of unknown function (DUF1588)/Protein of unknown function (DUF1585)/Protein of unknown function (DUF1587)/Protein of unknown function (DUF1595)
LVISSPTDSRLSAQASGADSHRKAIHNMPSTSRRPGCIFLYWLLVGLATSVSAQSPQPTTAAIDEATTWAEDVYPFLRKFCADCHSGEAAEAGIDLNAYSNDSQLSNERPRWEQIRGMIHIGAMPPADYDPQPSAQQRAQIAKWIDQRINTVDCNLVHDPGRVTMRRLNNIEYDNSVRDLLGFDPDFSPSLLVGFPSDEVGNGFDNQGEVLGLSQLQIEKYLEAATLIGERALTPPDSLSRRSFELPILYLGDQQQVRTLFVEGKYEIKSRLQFFEAADETVEVHLLVDNQKVDSFEVESKRTSFVTEMEMSSGWHTIQLLFARDPQSTEKKRSRRVEVESLTVRGPPPIPEPYAKLLRVRPSQDVSAEDAARENLLPLLRLAYRREPDANDVQRLLTVLQMGLQQGLDFEQAMSTCLQAILVSPHFLFRVEQEDPGQALNQYVLASRLSYFLWASLPDTRLLDLARDGQLSDAAAIEAEAVRMLADPKSAALVKRFFGQFLGLGNLRDVEPDGDRFPLWNDQLRDAMVRETELFCHELIASDQPIEALLQGDFTFVNPRLAELYGLQFEGLDPKELYLKGPGLNDIANRRRPGTYLHEDRWVRAQLPEQRRGVLTHASILTLTSNPTVTSPVKRGKWILESIIGDPPPPAPPNVPTLEETQKEHAKLSLREQLAIHRANPSCASCHDVMDPLGLGFENFDAIGRWREEDGDKPIDATGVLRDGRTFKGSAELVRLLVDRQPEINRFFSQKLLTYALGRGLEPYDNCAVDQIVQSASKRGNSVRSFILAVVASEPFTSRRPEPANENKP